MIITYFKQWTLPDVWYPTNAVKLGKLDNLLKFIHGSQLFVTYNSVSSQAYDGC